MATEYSCNLSRGYNFTKLPLASISYFAIILFSPVCVDTPLDVAFLVDASSSVGEENFQHILNYIKTVLSTTDINGGKVKAAVLTYSTDVTVHVNLADHTTRTSLYAAIDRIPYLPGWTNTASGLSGARKDVFNQPGDRSGVVNVALIISDGISNVRSHSTVLEADRLKDDGVYVMAVGVGHASHSEMNSIVSDPVEENSLTVEAFQDLRRLGEVLFPLLCTGGGLFF